jgi:hypothetical protein
MVLVDRSSIESLTKLPTARLFGDRFYAAKVFQPSIGHFGWSGSGALKGPQPGLGFFLQFQYRKPPGLSVGERCCRNLDLQYHGETQQ